jgi:hypothetical protein
MVNIAVPKFSIRSKSNKARLEAATNLEDTSKGLVLSSQPAERIRPSHGGLVQYYSPDEVGCSSSTSSASSVSDLSSIAPTPASARPQCRRGQQKMRKANDASTKKTSFSWKSGWHDRSDEDHEDWRGGWPGSEHVSEWRAHMKPTERALSSSSSTSTTSGAVLSVGTARSHTSTEAETQSPLDIEPSFFVGCQQVMPESPVSFYSMGWDRFPQNVEPPPYEPMLRYKLE